MSITTAINDLAAILGGSSPPAEEQDELYERLVEAFERMAACKCGATVTPLSGGCFDIRDTTGTAIYNYGQEFILSDPDNYAPDATKWGTLVVQGQGQGLDIVARCFVLSFGAEFGSVNFTFTDSTGTTTDTVNAGDNAELVFTPPAGSRFTLLIQTNPVHGRGGGVSGLSVCQNQPSPVGGVTVGSGPVRGASIGKGPKPPSPATPLDSLFFDFALSALSGRSGTLSARFSLPPAVTWIPGDVSTFITHLSGVAFFSTPWSEVGFDGDDFVIQAEITSPLLSGMLGRFFIPLTKFTYSSLEDVGLISVIVDFEED